MENPNYNLSKKDEHGSVLCKEFEEIQILMKDITQSFNEENGENQNLEGMNMKLKLAQLSSQSGGLLSPEFFLKTPELSTLDSSSDSVSSSNVSCHPHESDNITSEKNNQGAMTPFYFPKIVVESEESKSNEISTDELIHNMERVEILDDDLDGSDESKWEECRQKYIQEQNFRLGIQPGDFYKNKTHSLVCVKLPHRSNYEVLVTNNNRTVCHLDLYVNGKPTNALVLRPGETKAIDGPQNSKYAFKIFRHNDAPTSTGVNEGSSENCIVKAVFTPKMEGRLRSISEPLNRIQTLDDPFDLFDDLKEEKKPRSHSYTTNDGDKLERSVDMSQVAESLILLQGKQKKKKYIPTLEVEVDPSKEVVLQLKLIASLVEEVAATEEEVHAIESPTPSP